MFQKFKRTFNMLKAGLSKPIFRNTKERCPGLHRWRTIDELIEALDADRLRNFCAEEAVPPLDSLARGTPICCECGYLANHDININIENLVSNLRALDT